MFLYTLLTQESRGTMKLQDLDEAERMAVLQYTEDPRLRGDIKIGFGASGPSVGLEATLNYNVATGEELSSEAKVFRNDHLSNKARYS